MLMQLFKMVVSRNVTELRNLTKKTSSKKIIVRFVNRKYCKEALINRKNLLTLTVKRSITSVKMQMFSLMKI